MRQKVKNKKLLVGAAVGAGPKEFKRAEVILKENSKFYFIMLIGFVKLIAKESAI